MTLDKYSIQEIHQLGAAKFGLKWVLANRIVADAIFEAGGKPHECKRMGAIIAYRILCEMQPKET